MLIRQERVWKAIGMKKGAVSGNPTSSPGGQHGIPTKPSLPARGGPRDPGGRWRSKARENFSADEARYFAQEIRRMRRQELYFWLGVVAFTLLCTFALMAWGPQDGYSLAGMVVALAVASAVLHSVLTDHRCPHCRTELTPSGRYARGTLDGDQCPRCHAPFNASGKSS